jgi:hypothetical protein
MRIHLGVACVTIALLAGMMGCGSYSAPENPPSAPDSTGDSTPPTPYLQR